MIALLGVEVVVLYFFRIALKSYLLARSQETNLQLRLALCSFIEGYLDFSAKASSRKADVGLQSFEALIFGNLPYDDPSLPATLDGIEQIAKILQSVKSS